MALGSISVKRGKFGASKSFGPRPVVAKSVAGKLYAEAMESVHTDVNARPPVLRPSSFPLCSVLVYHDLMVGTSTGKFKRDMSAGGGYFTSVGTAAHTNIQFYIGKSGKVFGHWKCINNLCPEFHKARDKWKRVDDKWKLIHGKPTLKNTTNNVCPYCKFDMEYVELTVKHKKVEGHIDCVIMLDPKRKRIWVADYKTCTKNKIENARTKLPERSHLRQLPSYCYILEEKYGYKVEGFSLIYICRDNPWIFYEHAEPWTDAWRKRAMHELKLERVRYRSGVDAYIERDKSIAIGQKPCKSLAHYEKEMGFFDPCPLVDVCFHKKTLESALDKLAEKYPYTDKQVAKVLPRLSL